MPIKLGDGRAALCLRTSHVPLGVCPTVRASAYTPLKIALTTMGFTACLAPKLANSMVGARSSKHRAQDLDAPGKALTFRKHGFRSFNSLRLKPRRKCAASFRSSVTCLASKKAVEYNSDYGIEGSVAVVEGEGGLTKVRLTHYNGSAADVYLFGACVTSWTQPHGSEVLYLRPDVKFDGVKPISGGIPHCFPQFGPSAKMQQHGFARNCTWEVVSSSADVMPDYPEPAVLLQLTDNEYTRSMWDFSFKAIYEVTLKSDRLRVELRVQNTDNKPFDFTTALHSYIGVADASCPSVCVKGLKGKTYLDKVPDANNPVPTQENNEAVTFGNGLVDSVYLDTDPETILEVGTGCSVAVENTRGFSDTVVWNPHETLSPSCWKDFVCVESAQVSKPVELNPGEEWWGEVNVSVFDH